VDGNERQHRSASSLVFCVPADGATRPHYGGTLRVGISAPASLDPAEQRDSLGPRNVSRLIFDTLVELDDSGMEQPALAASWESQSGYQRWQFHLRPGVTFDDGTPLTAEAVAASLRTANPSWTVSATGDAIVIVRDAPAPGLPAELALAHNGIAKRGAGKIHGSGPFTVKQWDPGKRIALAAREDYWRGRPFVNSIEMDLGKNLREQAISLDLGKLDIAEVAPEQARQSSAEGRHVASSAPVELVALVFAGERQSPEDGRMREALALSVDRSSLNAVLLQGGGEPAGALLPNWMTGYSFVFSTEANLERARQAYAGLRQGAPWTLSYDSADPLLRLMAERIALNARDARLTLQPVSSGAADMRLVRIALASPEARTSLAALAANLGLPQPKAAAGSVDDLYAAESMLLQSQRVIPLLHLRTSYGLSAGVKNWTAEHDGSWDLPDVWLAAAKP
jgi:peptide/nickel transport system substrate-binding protein